MSRPLIEVDRLSKKYRLGAVGATTLREDFGRLWRNIRPGSEAAEPGEFWALRDVSFQIQAGDIVGLIGRNGAGKSTLLKILSRITEPSSGRAVLRGRVASLLEVGTGFHPDLTGRENILLNGMILGMKRAEVLAGYDEIVAFAEVAKFIDTPVKHYSSGMRVRLAFAIAAQLSSEILIIDEVLAVGDAEFQKKCLGRMSEVAQSGRTVLFVSHDMRKVAALCTRGILLNAGQIEAAGKMADVAAVYLEGASGADQTTALLAARRDRTGSGEATFQAISLLRNGSPAKSFEFGDRLDVKVTVHIARRLTVARIAIILTAENETPVHDFWNADAACPWPSEPGWYEFTVSVADLRLYPGTYSVDLWIEDDQRARVDYLTDTITFHVVQTPAGGIPRLLDRANGIVYHPSEWRCVPRPAETAARGILETRHEV